MIISMNLIENLTEAKIFIPVYIATSVTNSYIKSI